MTIKIYYETLDGKKRYYSSEMKKTKGDTYFDYIAVFKRCDDKIKEDFIIIVYNNDNKIIHKEKVSIHWTTNPSETKWTYGITLCGNRVVSEARYGYSLPVCCEDNRDRHCIKDGYPEKYYSYNSKFKNVSSTEFPNGILYKLSKIGYNI